MIPSTKVRDHDACSVERVCATYSQRDPFALASVEAAEDLKRNRDGFSANVKTSMRGGTVKGNSFDAVYKKS